MAYRKSSRKRRGGASRRRAPVRRSRVSRRKSRRGSARQTVRIQLVSPGVSRPEHPALSSKRKVF